MSKPRSVRSMLSGSGGVQRLLDRAQRLAELEKRVLASLPSSLAPHCRVANLRSGVLVLLTDSAALNSKLRFLLPRLTSQLRSEPELAELTRIELRVAPLASPRASRPVQRTLSDSSAELLRSSAEATTDPELRQALQRLARRHRA